jgi:hypothetical protein
MILRGPMFKSQHGRRCFITFDWRRSAGTASFGIKHECSEALSRHKSASMPRCRKRNFPGRRTSACSFFGFGEKSVVGKVRVSFQGLEPSLQFHSARHPGIMQAPHPISAEDVDNLHASIDALVSTAQVTTKDCRQVHSVFSAPVA